MQNSSRFGRYVACVHHINVRLTEPSYPQEKYITEGTYTARSIRFRANERRKVIPGFLVLVPYFATTCVMQNLVPGSP